MTRERVARVALRAYPEGVRRAHGPEMLATLLDTSDGSTRAFVRELWDLLRSGLRSRSRATAEQGLKRLIADGFCVAAMLAIAARISTPVGFQPERWQFCWLGAVLALALVGYDRVAGWSVSAGSCSQTRLRRSAAPATLSPRSKRSSRSSSRLTSDSSSPYW